MLHRYRLTKLTLLTILQGALTLPCAIIAQQEQDSAKPLQLVASEGIELTERTLSRPKMMLRLRPPKGWEYSQPAPGVLILNEKGSSEHRANIVITTQAATHSLERHSTAVARQLQQTYKLAQQPTIRYLRLPSGETLSVSEVTRLERGVTMTQFGYILIKKGRLFSVTGTRPKGDKRKPSFLFEPSISSLVCTSGEEAAPARTSGIGKLSRVPVTCKELSFRITPRRGWKRSRKTKKVNFKLSAPSRSREGAALSVLRYPLTDEMDVDAVAMRIAVSIQEKHELKTQPKVLSLRRLTGSEMKILSYRSGSTAASMCLIPSGAYIFLITCTKPTTHPQPLSDYFGPMIASFVATDQHDGLPWIENGRLFVPSLNVSIKAPKDWLEEELIGLRRLPGMRGEMKNGIYPSLSLVAFMTSADETLALRMDRQEKVAEKMNRSRKRIKERRLRLPDKTRVLSRSYWTKTVAKQYREHLYFFRKGNRVIEIYARTSIGKDATPRKVFDACVLAYRELTEEERVTGRASGVAEKKR